MAKVTYTTRQIKNKVWVFRVTKHYPNGTVAVKCRSQSQADEWVSRQIAENADS